MGERLSLISIPNAVETREGMPRPNWPVVSDWVESNVSSSNHGDAWIALAADWLDALGAALPAGYSRIESEEFMLLTNTESSVANRLLNWCENSRTIILDTLSGIARDDGLGKHVVLVFGDSDTYYDYLADFYPDQGEFGLSGGMFLDHGYGHLVLCMNYADQLERIIAHEITHALLRHLPMPLWLSEGVTQVVEDTVVGGSYFMIDREMVQRHRRCWNSNTIHSFWSGDCFFSPDEKQNLGYHLSQVLFRNLLTDYPRQVADFLNAAHYSDAGNAALIDACGVTLGDRMVQFLGAGEWNPRTDYELDLG